MNSLSNNQNIKEKYNNKLITKKKKNGTNSIGDNDAYTGK